MANAEESTRGAGSGEAGSRAAEPWWFKPGLTVLAGVLASGVTFLQGWMQRERELEARRVDQIQQLRLQYLSRIDQGIRQREMVLQFIVKTSDDEKLRAWATSELEKEKQAGVALEEEILAHEKQLESLSAELSQKDAEIVAIRSGALVATNETKAPPRPVAAKVRSPKPDRSTQPSPPPPVVPTPGPAGPSSNDPLQAMHNEPFQAMQNEAVRLDRAELDRTLLERQIVEQRARLSEKKVSLGQPDVAPPPAPSRKE